MSSNENSRQSQLEPEYVPLYSIPMVKSARRAYLTELSIGPRELDSDTSHYLHSVLRLRDGEEIEFFDGRGGVARALIETASKRSVKVEFLSLHSVDAHLPPIHLYCALPKGDRSEWLIEKCSELGATSLNWVIYERSQDHKRDHSKRFERWHKIACEAARQSYNAWVTKLEPPKKFQEIIKQNLSGTIVVLDTTDATRPFATLPLNLQEPISLFIGPEGGFSPDERKEFSRQNWLTTTLGPTVLRIETAAIAGVSAIRNHASLCKITS